MTQDKNLLDPEENALALDVDSLLAIHRHDDGNIAICRNVGGEWENLWMLTPPMLRGVFSAFRDWLLEDAYASTQAYWRTAPEGWVHKSTGLPAIGVDRSRPEGQRRWGRVTENLRYLNCLSCDLDCGRSDLDAKSDLEKVPWRDAQRRVDNLQDMGIIPAISMMGYSGRGLYVIWLLHGDRDPDHSARAYAHDVVTWKIIQKELMRRLLEVPLPVDLAGSLITQVYRIGGSRHSKTGERARYFIYVQADQNRRLISYTLRDMAKFLNLPAPGGELPDKVRKLAKPARCRRSEKPGSAPLRSHGYKVRHALIASDMLTIHAWRLADGSGGWQKRNQAYADGHRSPKYGRRMILTLYAQALICSMYSPKELRPPATIDADTRADVLSRLLTMARQCKPQYPSDPNDVPPEAILDAILRKYRPDSDGKQRLPPTPSTKTFCAAFGITADLARELDLKTIRPRAVALEDDRNRPSQAEYRNWRLEKLRQFLKVHGSAKTTSTSVKQFYKNENIKGANRQTANDDLNAIGFKMDLMIRSRGGRPRKRP